MSETYLVTAKTVEEAIAIANREYADESHEVSYEIIDMPKKGFLGIGARDAKIKITVSKIESADLGSLVNEIKSMKSITNRGGESRKEKAPAEKQNDRQQKQQSAQKQHKQGEKSAEKAEKSGEKQERNQNKPKQQPHQNQQSAQKQQNQPKQQKTNDKQQSDKQTEKKPVEKKPAEKTEKAEKVGIRESKPAEKIEVKTAATPAGHEKTEAKFGSADAEYTTSLRNDYGGGRRKTQLPKNPSSVKDSSDESAAVTVSSPVGLTDFVSENKSFGSEDQNSGYRRMSNDIRKKSKAPAQEKSAETQSEPVRNATPEEVAEKLGGNKKRRRGNRSKSQSTPLTQDEFSEMMKKYDIAESDEDAAFLESLIDAEAEGELDSITSSESHEPEKKEEKIREAVTEEEMECALEFANKLLENMQIGAKAVRGEPEEGEEFVTKEGAEVYPKINIIGDDTGILIGHHGETLDSIQYLINLSALRRTNQKNGDYVKIVVDIEDYREKREDTLRSLARRMASRAVKYKRNIYLEPMNAYERRIIHSELQTFENVSTHSVGADRDRKIVITYEGPDKQAAERQHENSRRDGSRSENSRRKKSTSDAGSASEGQKSESGKKHDRKPKKVQKMPIEALPSLLESREDSAAEPTDAE